MDIWNQDHEKVRQLIVQNNLIQKLDGQSLYVCSGIMYLLFPDEPAFHWRTEEKRAPWSGVLDCVLRFMLTMGDLKGPIEGLRV
jgi:hypothetical protein